MKRGTKEDGPIRLKPGLNLLELENDSVALIRARRWRFNKLIYYAEAFLYRDNEGEWHEQADDE